ncbi:Fc.00g071760.m01.CDS01 [Cosmosporella sp. VM-42]
MRTRKSNRSKRFTIEKYDFEGSSDEERLQRARNWDEVDENFDVAGVAEESAEEEDLAVEEAALESETFVSDPEGVPDRFSSQRIKPIRPFNVRAVGVTGYLDVEPVADGRIVRSYCGPYDRALRGNALVDIWYARLPDGIKKARGLLERWREWPVLPPKATKDEQNQSEKGVWSPNFFEREARNSDHWYERVKDSMPRSESWVKLSEEESQPYRLQRGTLPVLMGPRDSQQEVKFDTGDAYSLAQAGLPFEQDESDAKVPTGWIFDAGGIVIAMDWAKQQKPASPQVLAICVIPHSDQEYYDFEQESVKPDFQKHGIVQLWEVRGERNQEGYLRPSQEPPKLRKTLCFEQGRVRRVRWCPSCKFLAVICGDGNVYVVQPWGDADGGYEKLLQPVAIFTLTDEEHIKATAITWINFNRLVVGYSDGSVALWSIRPNRLLSRHPIHHNDVVALVSGYPSMPYLIASSPIGGTTRLLDLRAPSFETTEIQNLTVTTQPNLLGYSDHLLGFFSLYPSAGPLNTQVGFMYHAHYPVCRRVFTGQSFNSCLSVGRTHPYLLVGSMDGSLWALNPQVELFSPRREPSDRIKIFQHEHRPAHLFAPGSPASECGVSRIIQGFLVEKNLNPKTDFRPPVQKGKKKKKKDDGVGVGADEEDEGAGPGDPTRGVVYEPLTRITVVEWNPNEEYGHWAAAAMGSGLVRVLDLGVEARDD